MSYKLIAKKSTILDFASHSSEVSYYLEFLHGSTLSYVCDQKNEIRFLAFVAQKLILEHQSKPQLKLLLQHQEVHKRLKLTQYYQFLSYKS